MVNMVNKTVHWNKTRERGDEEWHAVESATSARGGDGHSYLDHGDGFQYTTNFNTQLHFTTQQKTNLYTTEICSQQNSPPKWQLRTRCGGHSCRRSMQAFADMLCHVPSMGSCSQFCLILQPHRVALPFTLIFASPWWHSFVQIHSGTTCFFVKIWDYPSKTTQKWPKMEVGVIIWYK